MPETTTNPAADSQSATFAEQIAGLPVSLLAIVEFPQENDDEPPTNEDEPMQPED